jgi:hypothetical protein
MRIPLIATVAALLIVAGTSPIKAQAQGMVVSSFHCPQSLPCDASDPRFPTTDELITMGSACVKRNFQVVPGPEVFETYGLDSNGCLTTNEAAFPVGGRATMVPHCCVKAFSQNVCALNCDVVAK